MKRLLSIFDLSKSEQRVVLIVMFALLVFAFVGYERRAHRVQVHAPTVRDVEATPGPVPTENEH